MQSRAAPSSEHPPDRGGRRRESREASIHLVVNLERAALVALGVLAMGFAFDRSEPLFTLYRVRVSSAEALVGAAVALWLLARLAAVVSPLRDQDMSIGGWAHRPHVPLTLVLPVVAWFGVLLISSLVAPINRFDGLKYSFKVIGAVLAGWMAYDLSSTRLRQMWLGKALVLGSLVISLIGLLEATRLPVTTAFLTSWRGESKYYFGILRISSTLVNPNFLAMVLSLLLPLMLAWAVTTQRSFMRVVLAGGLVVEVLALVLTLSRGGVVACLAGFGVVVLLTAVRRHKAMLYGSLVSIVLVLALTGAALIRYPRLVMRIVSETGREYRGQDEYLSSASASTPEPLGRVAIWQVALRMAYDRPLTGVGPQNYRWLFSAYSGKDRLVYHAHSLYFGWLGDTGVPGLLIFLWLSWRLLRATVRGYELDQTGDRSAWAWWLGAFAGMVAWFTHGLVDFTYAIVPTFVSFWLVAGLALSLADGPSRGSIEGQALL